MIFDDVPNVAESINFNYHFQHQRKFFVKLDSCGMRIFLRFSHGCWSKKFSIIINRRAFNKYFQSIHLDLVISGSLICFMMVPQLSNRKVLTWRNDILFFEVLIDIQLEQFWRRDDHKSSHNFRNHVILIIIISTLHCN